MVIRSDPPFLRSVHSVVAQPVDGLVEVALLAKNCTISVNPGRNMLKLVGRLTQSVIRADSRYVYSALSLALCEMTMQKKPTLF